MAVQAELHVNQTKPNFTEVRLSHTDAQHAGSLNTAMDKKKSPLTTLAESRRSIRKFVREAVPKQDLEKILTLALQAPSACNTQPCRFYVINDPAKTTAIGVEITKSLAGGDSDSWLSARVEDLQLQEAIFCDAPCVVAIAYHGDGKTAWSGIDVGFASMLIELAAQEIGYGSLTVGMTCRPQSAAIIKKHFKIPEEEQFMLTIALGKKHPEFVPHYAIGSDKKQTSNIKFIH